MWHPPDEDPRQRANTSTSPAHVPALTDELMRRLSMRETATPPPSVASNSTFQDHRDVSKHSRLFCDEGHDALDTSERHPTDLSLSLKWRQKEKLKTTAVALVLCLNIGVDPPDVIKISPCARLECWVDPNSMQPAKALEAIGKNLQAQYERWQPKAKYKMHLDPTTDDVKKLAQSSRRNAKNERVLFHYNGHGVPRPTANGELWVFNQRYTQYIPMSVYDLHTWLGTPAIYVLDCSSAGVLINTFRNLMDQRQVEIRSMSSQPYPPTSAATPSDPMREIIVLAACAANEVLPQSPELPADVFTACLTTPIKVALRWFASRSLLRHDGITKELIDKIPGRQTDRKTPLGELNWIFTAITDTVAWNVLPRALFQKLFRSDLLVASLFRNYLLAERIMTAAGCTPMSLPRLPPTHQHPMWQAWDMAAEMCLMQLPTLLSDPAAEFQPSPFFSEQLTAFELWLSSGSRERTPPEQLPIVLQVLLSQVHRLRALVLLGRFLDMGSWAVDLALSVGIFPYVLKLLQTTSQDLRATLVFIWAKILALDRTCQVDLIKDAGHLYFIRYLDSTDPTVDMYSRAQATFVLSVICDAHPKGQGLCQSNGLLNVLLRWLRTCYPNSASQPAAGLMLLLKWLCLCLGKLCQDSPEISLMAIREGAADLLVSVIQGSSHEIRAAAVFGLGCLVYAPGPEAESSTASPATGTNPGLGGALSSPLEDRLPAEQLIANAVRQVVYDPSVLVRCELAVMYARYARGHASQVQEALAVQQRRLQDFTQKRMQQIAAEAPAHSDEWVRGSHATRHSDTSSPEGSGGRCSRLPTDTQTQELNGTTGLSVMGGHLSSHSVVKQPSPIYTQMVESIQLLALDPSPRVAKLGLQVLRLAQCELSFVPASAVNPQAQPATSGTQTSAAATLGAFASKLRRPGWASSRSSVMQSLPQSNQLASATTTSQRPSFASVSGMTSAPSVGPAVNAPTLGPATSLSSGAGSGSLGGNPDSVPHEMTAPSFLDLHSSQQQTVPPSIPGTPSHASSPSSPVRDQFFSRPLYVLCLAHEHDGWPRSQNWPITAGMLPSMGPMGQPGSAGASPAAASGAQAPLQSGGGGAQMPYQQSGAVGGATAAAAGGGGVGRVPQSSTSSIAGAPHGEALQNTASVPQHAGGTMSYPGASGSLRLVMEQLPHSRIYKLSCRAFARPLLEPGASNHFTGPHWTAPPDLKRRQERVNLMHQGMVKCALTQPKIRDQMYSVDTQGEGLAKICFHPYHSLLICADCLGYIRVLAYDTPTPTKPIHVFHASTGPSAGDSRPMPTVITHLQHITEADGPLLLTGAADGAVRIWRSHAVVSPPGPAVTMATAFQSVAINLPPATGRSTTYAWSGFRSHLFAAGGSHPDMVYCWDMQQETCAVMIPMGSSLGMAPHLNPAVDSLHLGVADPHLLLAACNDHALRLFDIRAPRMPVLTLMPFKGQLAGVALEPAARAGIIIAASEKGEMVLLDSRAALNVQHQAQQVGAPLPGLAELSTAATSKLVAAHSKGSVSCVAAHQYAPLLATGTLNNVVKIWTDQCDPVGAVRAHTATPAAQKAGGAVSCMAWHAYQPLLAAGGWDSVATVYCLDQAPGAVNRDSQRLFQ